MQVLKAARALVTTHKSCIQPLVGAWEGRWGWVASGIFTLGSACVQTFDCRALLADACMALLLGMDCNLGVLCPMPAWQPVLCALWSAGWLVRTAALAAALGGSGGCT